MLADNLGKKEVEGALLGELYMSKEVFEVMLDWARFHGDIRGRCGVDCVRPECFLADEIDWVLGKRAYFLKEPILLLLQFWDAADQLGLPCFSGYVERRVRSFFRRQGKSLARAMGFTARHRKYAKIARRIKNTYAMSRRWGKAEETAQIESVLLAFPEEVCDDDGESIEAERRLASRMLAPPNHIALPLAEEVD